MHSQDAQKAYPVTYPKRNRRDKKYNASSISSSSTTSSKLDKAKSNCTDLGFAAGTEKHGDCVEAYG